MSITFRKSLRPNFVRGIVDRTIHNQIVSSNKYCMPKCSMNMSSTPSNVVKEISIEVPYGYLRGNMWNHTGQKTPILALHGWLDNAGTWDHIVPYLDKNHPLLAIDLPGHGLSSFPQVTATYFTDNLPPIEKVLQHFQWKTVILLGHSMGGAVGMLYSAVFPERIKKLIMIDALRPMHVNPEDQPARIANSLTELRSLEEKLNTEPPQYRYSEMLQKTVTSYGKSITEESAKTLLKRGARKHDNGLYSYTFSPVLKMTSLLSTTVEQQKAFASRVRCDTLVIRASASPLFGDTKVHREVIEIFKKYCKTFTFDVVNGTHHVHLNNPQEVAAIINNFLNDIPQSEDRKKVADDYFATEYANL